jgi:hypothetical protein
MIRAENSSLPDVGLAAVVLEEHAGRAMQLGHDHTLGAVDDERASRGHERNLAHVDFLLLHFLDRFLGRFAVQDHQAHARAQRGGKGQAALLALLHVESRLAEGVADEFQARIAAVADDRKDRCERRLQADVAPRPVASRPAGSPEGLDLGCQQEGNIQNSCALGKALADAFFLGVGVRHGSSGSRSDRIRDQNAAFRDPVLGFWPLIPATEKAAATGRKRQKGWRQSGRQPCLRKGIT